MWEGEGAWASCSRKSLKGLALKWGSDETGGETGGTPPLSLL